MIGFRSGGTIGDVASAKAGFFDRKRVLSATDRATRKVLSKFGAYVRQRARTSIRKRKGVSEPGRPPSSHVGLLRDLILFAYEPSSQSVVIGPARLNKPGEAPRLLEEGGEATRMRRGRPFQAHYRPRPFMKPAFDAELAKMGPDWRDSIR